MSSASSASRRWPEGCWRCTTPSADVTVVVPAHGPGPYLAQAVASALADEPHEVLVVEDGTAGVDEASLGGARLLRLPHVRRSRARNAGVEAATTPYVAFLDEDDVSLPGRFQRQRAALEAAPDATLAYARVRVVDAGLQPLDDWNELLARRFDAFVRSGSAFATLASFGGPLYTSATMVRRDRFLAAGGFDSAFDAYEDLDLYLRLARARALVPCPGAPVTDYRVHGGNTPSDALYRGMLAVTEKHLDEARGRDRQALLERRVDALWGLGRYREARRAAFAAVRAHPRLVAHPAFARRLPALALPDRVLAARR